MAKGRILRLRGLPWSAREDEVRLFLEDHAPVDLFVLRRGEKSTGEAFVEFGTTEEAAAAQADRNRKNLGQRYIEIFSTDAESMKELRGEVEELETGWVLRLRGLPYSASAQDVLDFFEGLEVLGGADGIILSYGKDGRPIGEAYVEFTSEEAQQEAMGRDKERIGTRYIEIFRASKADMLTRAAGLRQSDTGSQGDWVIFDGQGQARMAGDGEFGLPHPPGPSQPVMMDGSTLRLRGLPYSANVDDILKFFADFNVTPEAVQISTRIGRDGHDQCTGIAFVQFESPEEAEAARSEKHRKSIGSRYIECHAMYPRGPLQQPGMPGPTAVHASPRGMSFIPSALPVAALPGPGVLGQPGPGTPSVMQGAYQYEGPTTGPQARASGRLSYGVPACAPAPQMVPVGVPGPPFPGRHGIPGPPGGGQMHSSQGRQGVGWRGSRAASPGPMPGMSMPMAPSAPIAPIDFQQQQMLMQHQQFMIQHHLMHQQQQAMSQLRHPGWGMPPMGGAFAPYGAAMRPQLPLQRPPPPQTARPAFSGHLDSQQPLSFAAGQPGGQPQLGSRGPVGVSAGMLRETPGQSPGASAIPPASQRKSGAHAFPLSPGPAAGASPASSLQSELQSLTLASRSQSTASRAASGAVAQSPGLPSGGLPQSPHSAQQQLPPPPPPPSHQE